jgi:hypothetical protein
VRASAAVNDGVSFIVEWSDILAASSWSSVGVTEQVLSDNGTSQTVVVRLPGGASGRRFVRLKISKP